MSWECKNLNETNCTLRNKPCDPGAEGCILQGKYYFPFDDSKNKKKSVQKKTEYKENHIL